MRRLFPNLGAHTSAATTAVVPQLSSGAQPLCMCRWAHTITSGSRREFTRFYTNYFMVPEHIQLGDRFYVSPFLTAIFRFSLPEVISARYFSFRLGSPFFRVPGLQTDQNHLGNWVSNTCANFHLNTRKKCREKMNMKLCLSSCPNQPVLIIRRISCMVPHSYCLN